VGGIKANIEGGSRFLTENLEIDHSVIFAAKRQNVKNFLYIGSSCMYPANFMKKLTTQDLLTAPFEPTNADYALAKLTGTKAVEAIALSTRRTWRTFVASNLYGPGDHFDLDRSHLLAAIILKIRNAMKNGQSEIVMWGDGTPRREFTYVNDFSSWIAHSIEDLDRFPPIMNVGSGIDFTIKEYYEIAMDCLNFEGRLEIDLTKPSGNLRKLMDSSVAIESGWNPQTTISTGIRNTYQWLEKNHT
jgi:GDP-L-fucose synthase